ncbi:MAG TPA: hypothetical protein VFZ09_11095 [Archangium sp.]|uniref:hypothetical protein n=1 Tax=Archangium sp. TaxID=1872627 RepID=UPI002E3357CE|nr:hypothetical protein [Archangium sp.]HEX5746784.1 hypothetical protein [Archangium sp.]
MRSPLIHSHLRSLLAAVLLTACSSEAPEDRLAHAGEDLGTVEAQVCSGSNVTTLTIAGISSYQREVAGSGSWTVVSPANAVRLEYFVDGTLFGMDERPGTSGTWYFSAWGMTCGAHGFTVRATPMVIDSAGNRTTCFSTSRSTSQTFTESCPPLYWSPSGPIAGKFCTPINESADPHTWNDNHLCADVNYGFQWNSAGPIPGLRCTQITESAEPASHTWMDNYLCVPQDSPLVLSWSSAKPIAGKICTQWYEPSDPHTWNDNYLCY